VTDPSDTFATPRVAAGALFFDDEGRVLLVHPTYKETWDIPGGYVERGESPAAACQREIAEELRISRTPKQLLSVDWAPNENEGDKILFLFDCGTIGEDVGRINLNHEELDTWRWVALKDLDRFVISRIARRIRSTVSGGSTYLEHGELPRS
jgi:8-oxo-dGTP diphosphatase